MNARFFALNRQAEYIVLTLKPGQTLSWSYGGPDEEGWSSHAESWAHEGYQVRRIIATDGVDCDGRMSTYQEVVCSLERLRAYVNYEGIGMPDWDQERYHQRDDSAERAGY